MISSGSHVAEEVIFWLLLSFSKLARALSALLRHLRRSEVIVMSALGLLQQGANIVVCLLIPPIY